MDPLNSDFLVAGFRGTSTLGPTRSDELKAHYRVLCEVPGMLALVPRIRSKTLQDERYRAYFPPALPGNEPPSTTRARDAVIAFAEPASE